MHAPDDNDLHGVVSRRELLASGLGRGAIEHRLSTGRLFKTYRGVYAAGRPDLTVWGRRRAIVLACGAGAVLSHRSAASAWGLRPTSGAMWEVTLPGTARVQPDADVKPYRRRLADHEITTLHGIAVTTVARTLFDLSSVIPIHHERRAIERAVELDLFHLPDLQRILDAQHGRRGAPALVRLLRDFRAHGLTRTHSDLEAAFLQLCLDHHLPRPRVNHYADGREADFTWGGSDLIVEIDSWRHHRHHKAFTTDRAKDRAALRQGRRTARFTGDEIEQRPAQVAAELRELLAGGSSGEGGIRTLGGP
jgi:very-short-patch-repair endonuclease